MSLIFFTCVLPAPLRWVPYSTSKGLSLAAAHFAAVHVASTLLFLCSFRDLGLGFCYISLGRSISSWGLGELRFEFLRVGGGKEISEHTPLANTNITVSSHWWILHKKFGQRGNHCKAVQHNPKCDANMKFNREWDVVAYPANRSISAAATVHLVTNEGLNTMECVFNTVIGTVCWLLWMWDNVKNLNNGCPTVTEGTWITSLKRDQTPTPQHPIKDLSPYLLLACMSFNRFDLDTKEKVGVVFNYDYTYLSIFYLV